MKDFQSVLDDYWDAAYREGEERRILDDGTAQEALSWLQAYNREAEANKERISKMEAAINEAYLAAANNKSALVLVALHNIIPNIPKP